MSRTLVYRPCVIEILNESGVVVDVNWLVYREQSQYLHTPFWMLRNTRVWLDWLMRIKRNDTHCSVCICIVGLADEDTIEKQHTATTIGCMRIQWMMMRCQKREIKWSEVENQRILFILFFGSIFLEGLMGKESGDHLLDDAELEGFVLLHSRRHHPHPLIIIIFISGSIIPKRGEEKEGLLLLQRY